MSEGSLASSAEKTPVWAGTRYLVLLGAIVVQLILGTVYGYSIFWQPLETEVGLAQPLAKYAFAICILSFAVVMVVAGRVQDILGPRIPAIIGAVLMGGGFLLAGQLNRAVVFHVVYGLLTGAVVFVVLAIIRALTARWDSQQHSLISYIPWAVAVAAVVGGLTLAQQIANDPRQRQLLLLWSTVGFLAGAGIGFAYVCPIAALVKWFPEHKGLVSGLAVAGFGLGAFIFSRPELPFSAENFIKTYGILKLFSVHGLVCIVAVTLGALLLRNPPGLPPRTAPSESAWQETLRRPAFWTLWLMFFSGALAGLMVIGIVKPFVQGRLAGTLEPSAAARVGAAAVGVLAIFNALGRVIWGLLSDRLGRTPTFLIMFAVQALVMFLLGGLSSEMALYIGAALVGFNFGGNFALFPSACADFFGAKNLGANYGWLFTSYGIAGVVGIYAGNTALAWTGSYYAAFAFAGTLCVLSAVLAVVLGLVRKRQALAAGQT